MRRRRQESQVALALLAGTLVAGTFLMGCVGGAANSGGPSLPPGITVSITPTSATVFLGATQQFTATVANASNPTVSWSVDGVPGGNPVIGTITVSGLYTAPQSLGPRTTVTIQATSQQDPTRSATAEARILSDILVRVAPATADVELGAVQQFQAIVTGSGNPHRAVHWSVEGPACQPSACGVIHDNGLFVAPQVRPAPPSVTAVARSAADPASRGLAAIQITSNFTLTVSGPDSVDTDTTVQFTATLTPAPDSNPSRVIHWDVSGPGCTGASCGTISDTGRYTAPPIAPSPPSVNIIAIPEADPSRLVLRPVTIRAVVSVRVTPASASVELGRTQQFIATVSGVADRRVTWEVNGIVGGDEVVGTVTNSIINPNETTYTAPIRMPDPSRVTVSARSSARPDVVGNAAVTLLARIEVRITPPAATRAVNHRQTFLAEVVGSPDQNVEWQVNGIPGGNPTVGRICIVEIEPCQQVSRTNGGRVDYLAPASVPAVNPVRVSATSLAVPGQTGNAFVTILAHVQVSVAPSSVTLPPRAVQQFHATVEGTSDQNVVWRISGPGCGGAGSPCGTIDPMGLYTAPFSPPSPNVVTITATSTEDTSRSGYATATIATGPNVAALLPASVMAGAVGGFLLKIQGSNFAASSPGPGSTILFSGAPKVTYCESRNECTTPLVAGELAAPGNRAVQVRNPDSALSNQVVFVVAQPSSIEDVITLTAGSPNATGKDIVVVEPSTAGMSSERVNLDLHIAAGGLVRGTVCEIRSGSIVLARPAEGPVTYDICIFSSAGLDPRFTYTITGPVPNDITLVVPSGQDPGSPIIHLRLSLSPATRRGARTLFVENPNKDKAAASGAIEVK